MIRKIWIVVLLAIAGYAAAQDIRITRFERCYTCIGASMNPVYDNTGKACALIRFAVRDTSMVIEPNNGYMMRKSMLGEIQLYVPVSTKRLTLRATGLKLLRDYEIPVKLIQKATYDADVETASVTPLPTEEKNVEEPEQEPQEPIVAETPQTKEEEQLIVWPSEPEETETVKPIKRHSPSNTHFMTGLGWNILPVNGPELLLGIDASHHVIELSGVYGLKKTDPLYYFSTNREDENPYAGWQYTAISGSLSYGYDVFPEAPASMVPMIGVKGNIFNGKTADGMKGTKDDFKKASSVSAFVALRLTLSLGKHFKLQVTPRYDLSVSKSNNCKLICDYDDTLKGWTRGFNLSAGLIIK